ncbi:MAG: hypothetical protein AAF495_08915 [Pseudomonadota bacterium]
MTKRLSALAASLFVLAFTAPAGAQTATEGSQPCKATVDKQLATWQIPADEVSGISYIKKWSGAHRAGGSHVMGVNAWISLKSCRGELVVDMDKGCLKIQSYATGDCGSAIKGGD